MPRTRYQVVSDLLQQLREADYEAWASFADDDEWAEAILRVATGGPDAWYTTEIDELVEALEETLDEVTG
jgi:hypothetical protein